MVEKKETSRSRVKSSVDTKKTTKTIEKSKKEVSKANASAIKPVKVKTEVQNMKKNVGTSKTIKERKNIVFYGWCVFFAIAFVGYSITSILAKTTIVGAHGYYMSATNWWSHAGELLFIFALIAGYLLISHFKKENSSKSATQRAWAYLVKIGKKLLPLVAIGYFFGLIVSKFYFGYDWSEVLNITLNSFWTFLGLGVVGFSDASALVLGNQVLWFISAVLVVSYFLYWALAKSEEKTCGIVLPIIFLFFGGYWASLNISGLDSGLIFVLVGMSAGILIYYLVEKLKTIKYSAEAIAFLSFVYMVVAGLLIWYAMYPTKEFAFNPCTIYLFSIIIVTLTILASNFIKKFLTNEIAYGVLSFLGEASIYLYVTHYPIILIVLMIAGKNNPGMVYTSMQIFWPSLMLSFIFSILIKLTIDTIKIKKTNN